MAEAIKKPFGPAARSGKIEAGVDAVIIGAEPDGLAAAALLGKAGLNVVLVEGRPADIDNDQAAEESEDAVSAVGGIIRRREFSPGYFAVDGPVFTGVLHPAAIEELDLYRYGLSFAQRKIETVYYPEKGGAYLMDGDLLAAYENAAEDDPEGAQRAQSFFAKGLEDARVLRGDFDQPGGEQGIFAKTFAGGGAEPESASLLTTSLDAYLNENLEDEELKSILAVEGSLGAANGPEAPMTALSLLRRWAGESVGLQGALSYPAGGGFGLIEALRRAAQAAKVDMRTSSRAHAILVERDAIGGVVLEDGSQIRTKIVIGARSASRIFDDLVGADKLELEFQRASNGPRPRVASAQLHFALKGEPGDERTQANLKRRLVYAPNRNSLRAAFHQARSGEIPSTMILEVAAPSALDDGLAPSGGQVISVNVHPLPFVAEPDGDFRNDIIVAVLALMENIAPGISGRIITGDVVLPTDLAEVCAQSPQSYGAAPVVMRRIARAAALTTSSGIEGLYFCGAEAQTGDGMSLAAGWRAAHAAIDYAKSRGGGR